MINMDFLAAFSPLTMSVIGIIIVLTLYFHGPVYSLRTVNAAPSILTSIGIFGTFLGVALGLMDFNTQDIEGSVPPLIEGLKTAFWSSIAGLLAAMSIKLRHVILHVSRGASGTKTYTGATVDDLARFLDEIRQLLSDAELGRLPEHLSAGNKGLEQHLERLESVIEGYQQEMVSANSSALTEAITELMQSFNEKITVQYGDNFRHLNEAVGRMVEWQDNYKDELAKLLQQQRTNGDVLDKATEAYQTMVQHTQAFNAVSEKLGDVMTGLQQQSESLGSYLESLANLVSKASDGLPALEGRIMALTEELANGIRESHRQMNELLLNTSSAIEQTVITVNRQLVTEMEQVNAHHHQIVLKMLDRNEQQLVRMDTAMEQELTHALQTFGGQLTALSEKFVSDYLPLTEKLRLLVEATGRIDSTRLRSAPISKSTASQNVAPQAMSSPLHREMQASDETYATRSETAGHHHTYSTGTTAGNVASETARARGRPAPHELGLTGRRAIRADRNQK